MHRATSAWLKTKTAIQEATGKDIRTVTKCIGDSRFPAKTAQGWSKLKVQRFFKVRDLEVERARKPKVRRKSLERLREIKLERDITLLDQRIALFDGKYLSAESWQGLADEHLTICCAMLAELVQWVEAEFRTPEAVKKARQIENKGRRLLRDAVERKYLEAQAESTGGPA